MVEQLRQPRATALAGGGGYWEDRDGGGEGLVQVSSAGHDWDYSVAGMTIGQVRAMLHTDLHLEEGTPARVNGERRGEDTVVQAGEHLSFRSHAGEKGRAGSCAAGGTFAGAVT